MDASMKKRYAKRLASLLLSLALMLSMAPAMAFAAGTGDAQGEVIVMFRDGAVSEEDMSLRSARSMKLTGADFGAASEAAGAGEEAAEAAKSEAEIIKDSLGSGFVIEDSLLFEDANSSESDTDSSDGKLSMKSAELGNDGLRIALISSDRYSTEEMIEMLSGNPDIAAVEPNTSLQYQDYDSYSLNDRYASYLYQDNAPAAKNTGGDSVSARGGDPQAAISANAASGWKKLSGKNDEVVIAVVDTGINLEHEDLVNRLWTNPGNIDLAGEHGYNFADNNTDIMDHVGHGSHCAGLIAAEANNGKGVAGVAGGANVKIMMLKTSSDTDDTKLYTAMGSYNYALKAKQRGVNVVATSNSWGRGDSQSTIFNAVVDKMGEGGILTFTAAGNASKDLDKNTDNPASNESEYGITVGAAGINGKPAGFSNYGRTSVDVFASGVNTLSTVGYKCYMPNIYDKSERRSTTEYFGKFTTDSKVSKNTITPYTPDKKSLLNPKGMKAFGKFEFLKQDASYGTEEYVPSDASCEISVVKDHYFTTGDKAASLKVTIHGATAGEEYYVFFPFDKNKKTTGKNTRFSIMYQSGNSSGAGHAEVFGGEVYKDEKGVYHLTGGGVHGHPIGKANDGVDTHLFNDTEEEGEYAEDKISDYKKGEKTGIGLEIVPEANGDWERGTSQDLVLYIDSIGVTKPGAELSLSNAYEMMSGTSMACPSAAGACALMASIYPKKDSQTDAEYAGYIRNKLFSCVRQTDELAGLCSTGGYIDFRLLTTPQPVIDDAVCDVDAGTLTLYGENMDPGMTLTYRRLAQKDSGAVTLPEEGMKLSYADDGSSVVIENAQSLFGSYLEFEMKDAGGASGKRSFFTVKGQTVPEMKAVKHNPNPAEADYTVNEPNFKLFTNAAGSQLYALDNTGGGVYFFDGKQFVALDKGNIKDALTEILAKEYDDYELTTNLDFFMSTIEKPVVDGDILYYFISYVYKDASGSGEESTYRLIGRMDLSAEEPEWTFEADEAMVGDKLSDSFAFLNGILYFAGKESEFSSYDPVSKTISEEADIPDGLSLVCLTEYKGDIYMTFGADWNYKGDDLADSLSDSVYRYDTEAKTWDLVSKGKVKYIGKYDSGYGRVEYQTSVASTDKGIAIVNMSIDGAGNVSLFDPENDTLTPMYYTFNNGLSDQPLWGSVSCVTTKDGIWYMRDDSDEMRRGYGLWQIPVPASSTDITGAKVVLSASDLTYNGKVQKPSIRTIGGMKLIKGTDYTVKWSNKSSKNVGSYTLTITGKGKYTGSTKASYRIDPKGTSIKSLKGAGKAVSVSWKKQSAKMSKARITGYQIQLANNKKFTKNKKTVTVKGYSNTSKKIGSLKAKRKYYVRVRTYKSIGSKKYYSPWSKVKTVTTK